MSKKVNVSKLVATAMLSAIIVVIQLFLSQFSIAGFPITLTLIPIILGATMYGKSTGAILGGVFGVIVCWGVITGADKLGNAMLQYLPALTLAVCMIKGIISGYLSGLVFDLFKKRNKTTIGLLVAAIICPIINTGLLCTTMAIFFETVVTQFALSANFTSAANLILSGILVANFIPELVVNIVAVPAISKAVTLLRK